MISAGHGSVFGDPLDRDPNHNAGVSRLAYEYVPYDGPIVDREFARENGLRFYFTGKMCRKGHISQWLTKIGTCSSCRSIGYNRAQKKAEESGYFKEYYVKNRERILQRCKKYIYKNPEVARRATRKFAERNPEKVSLTRRVCDQRRRCAEGRYDKYDILRIGKMQKWKCAYCRVSIKSSYHIDHIEPISKGGSNWPSNLQLLCQTCNQKKHAKDPIDWARENGRLL